MLVSLLPVVLCAVGVPFWRGWQAGTVLCSAGCDKHRSKLLCSTGRYQNRAVCTCTIVCMCAYDTERV